jgi:hypothetical protein
MPLPAPLCPFQDSLTLPAVVSALPARALCLPTKALGEGTLDELAGAAAKLSTDDPGRDSEADNPDLPSWLERTFASNAATRFVLEEASMLCRTAFDFLRRRQWSASPYTPPACHAVIQWRSIQTWHVQWDTTVVETDGTCSPSYFRPGNACMYVCM